LAHPSKTKAHFLDQKFLPHGPTITFGGTFKFVPLAMGQRPFPTKNWEWPIGLQQKADSFSRAILRLQKTHPLIHNLPNDVNLPRKAQSSRTKNFHYTV
jgi:hypothetical protein